MKLEMKHKCEGKSCSKHNRWARFLNAETPQDDGSGSDASEDVLSSYSKPKGGREAELTALALKHQLLNAAMIEEMDQSRPEPYVFEDEGDDFEYVGSDAETASEGHSSSESEDEDVITSKESDPASGNKRLEGLHNFQRALDTNLEGVADSFFLQTIMRPTWMR